MVTLFHRFSSHVRPRVHPGRLPSLSPGTEPGLAAQVAWSCLGYRLGLQRDTRVAQARQVSCNDHPVVCLGSVRRGP